MVFLSATKVSHRFWLLRSKLTCSLALRCWDVKSRSQTLGVQWLQPMACRWSMQVLPLRWQIWIEDFVIGKWTDSKAFGPVSRTLPFACLPRWMVHLASLKAVCKDLAGQLASHCASLKCPNCFLKRVRTRRDSAFLAESNYFWESLYLLQWMNMNACILFVALLLQWMHPCDHSLSNMPNLSTHRVERGRLTNMSLLLLNFPNLWLLATFREKKHDNK